MFKVECPGCKAPYQVDERRVPPSGLKMRCPKCGSSFHVEPPPQDPRGTSPSPVLSSPDIKASPEAKPPLPARKPKLKGTMIGVAPPLARPAGKGVAIPRPKRDEDEPELPSPRAAIPSDDFEGPTVRQDVSSQAQAVAQSIELDLPAPRAAAPPLPKKKPPPPIEMELDLPSPSAHADLPSPARAVAKPGLPTRPAPRTDALELDLPSPAAAARPSSIGPSSLELDLPSPAIGIDLPSPARDFRDLPSPARGGDLPSPVTGRSANADLPSPVRADLPAVAKSDAAGGLGFGEIDLPIVSADLPSPAAGLPAAPAGLPMPAAGLPEVPSESFDVFGEEADPFGVPAAHAPTNRPFESAPSGSTRGRGSMQPVAFGDAPEDAFDGASLDAFGEEADPFGAPPAESFDKAFPEAQDDAKVVRASGGGTEYGEVNLDDGSSSGAVALESGAPQAPPPPPEEDMEFGAIPEEPAARAARSTTGGIGVPGSALAEIQAKKRRRRLRIAVAIIVVLSVGGGALTLVPALGPFGAYFIIDQAKKGEYERLLSDAVADAHRHLGADTFPESRAALAVLENAARSAKRFKPIAAYEVFIGFSNIVRFGEDPELRAASKVRLDEFKDEVDVDKLDLARAAQAAADGQLARARQMIQRIARQHPDDVDAAIMSGEVELKARDDKAAVLAWTAAAKLEKSARTAFGLARARMAAGDVAGSKQLAEDALKQNPKHIGARLLLARILWDTTRDEEGTIRLLDDVLKSAQGASPDEVVRAQTQLGEVHLNRGRITQAEQAFGEALRIDPKASRALSGFGDALFRASRYSQALARYKAAAEADPDDIAANVGIAKTSIQLERLEEAKTMLEKLRAAHPKDMQVSFWFGRVQELLGNRDSAEKAYRDAIDAGKKDPEAVQAYVALAALQSQQGKLDDANATLEQAQQQLPESPAIHKAIGKVAISQGHYTEGEAAFQKALELDAQDVDAKFLLGTALSRAREFDKALEVFEQVGKVDRDYPGLALERGMLFQESGRTDEALKEYEAALAKAPNDPDLMLRVGCGKAAAGNGSAAETLLRSVLAQRPNSAETHHCLGRALLARNNLSDAIKELTRAVQIDPNRAEYHLYVGWAANEAGDLDQASDSLKKALELDQGLADGYWQRGVLRLRQGRPKDAIADLTKALELRPSRYEVNAALADAYYDLGQEAQALACWQKAIAAKPDEPTWRFRYGKLLNINLRLPEAAEQLQKAIELAQSGEVSYAWLPEAHRLAAMSLGNNQAAVEHWQAFLRTGPADSPFRAEAMTALRRLGHPWEN